MCVRRDEGNERIFRVGYCFDTRLVTVCGVNEDIDESGVDKIVPLKR